MKPSRRTANSGLYGWQTEESRIDAPFDDVWRALTTPRTLKTYFMGSDIESDWKVGPPIRFRGEYKGKAYEDRGEIRAFEPGKRVAFSHFSPLSGAKDVSENYNLISIEFEAAGAKTKVTLTQPKLQGEPKADDLKQKDESARNWTTVLDGLDKASPNKFSQPERSCSTRMNQSSCSPATKGALLAEGPFPDVTISGGPFEISALSCEACVSPVLAPSSTRMGW